MSITLSALQQQRRDTAANWTSANPTLLAGEIGVETDTGLLKIGDGSTAWTSLDYLPLSFEGYAANGIYNPAANQVALATNGTGRLFIDSSGNIGVGISTPGRTLDVSGSIRSGGSTNPYIALNDGTAEAYFEISGSETRVSSGTSQPLLFRTGSDERIRIDSSGRLLVGTSSALSVDGNAGFQQFQVAGLGASISRFVDSGAAPVLSLSKSRSDTVGTNTVVQSGDSLGILDFRAADGSSFIRAAEIRAQVDGTPGTNDMPGRLTFSTTADGASSATERMRIDSSGNVGIDFTPKSLHTNVTSSLNVGSSSLFQRTKDSYFSSNFYYNSSDIGKSIASGYAPIYAQDVTNGAHVWYSSTNASAADETVSISERMRIDSSGNVGIGTSSPGFKVDVQTASGECYIKTGNGTASSLVGIDSSSRGSIGTVTAHSLVLNTNDQPRMLIDSSGRVGVGTTSPSQRLHVGNTADNTKLLVSSSYEAALELENGGGSEVNVINSAGSGNLSFRVSNSEKMRIDSSGRVGIGTTSPSSPLHVKNAGSTACRLILENSGSGSDDSTQIWSQNNDLAFNANDTERMRIDSSGAILVDGTAVPSAGAGAYVALQGGDNNCITTRRAGTANRTHISFVNDNGAVGSITTSASATAFNTSSDYRLKENVVDISDGIARVKQLQPKRFNFIADDSRTVDGFLAHEAQTVVPEAVTGAHNEVDDDGDPIYQGIDQAKLVPLLTAALQEAIAKIETLESKVAALEAAN